MSLPVEINPHLLGSTGGYEIAQSLRFDSDSSAKLIRTPGSASNRKTWTFSCWVKRAKLSSSQYIFHCYDGAASRRSGIQFNSDNTIGWDQGGDASSGLIDTVAVYRDVSAWYHLVCVADYTNGTAANRAKIYINGSLQTVTTTDDFENADGLINSTEPHQIGSDDGTSNFFNGYLSEIHFIDGQALDPSYFAQTNTTTGLWSPIEYTGTYGTNGFYLPFTENDVLFTTTSGGKFSTQSATGARREKGNDSAAFFSGMTISGDFDLYWRYGTASGSLTPGDAYIVGVVAASYQSSFNYNDNRLGASANTVFYTQYGASGFYTGAYVSGSNTDTLTSSDNPSTTTYVRMTRSGSTLYVYQGSPGSWTLKKTFTGTFSGDLYWFFGSGDKDENISLNNITFASINGGTRTLTDAGTLAADVSGNGNGWGTQGFQTSGTSNDQMVDSPTSYGVDAGVGAEVRGNYSTLNSLWPRYNTSGTFSRTNLQYTGTGAAGDATFTFVKSTIAIPANSTGKWYWETQIAATTGRVAPGIVGDNFPGGQYGSFSSSLTGNYAGAGAQNGVFYKDGSSVLTGQTGGGTVNDYAMFAYDASSGKLWYGVNGTWWNSGVPASGTGQVTTLSTSLSWFPSAWVQSSSDSIIFNFGQLPFAYSAPSGFKCLVDTNLPESTIKQGNDYFNAKLWSGNGSTQSITGIGFQPDLVWTKDRGALYDHTLFDVLRGATTFLRSNSSSAEETRADSLTSFDSDGFSVGADAVRNNINKSSASYVSWAWKAGGSVAANNNTSGNVTSTVSASTISGFSEVTFTIPSSGTNFSIGHGLGQKPAMIVVKNRGGNNWQVAHKGATNMKDYYITLNGTGGLQNSTGIWAIEPDANVFGISTGIYSNSTNIVAYCWAEIEGYSKFGIYTGNGSADGPFIYLGFRPRYWLIKKASDTDTWAIHDTVRDTYNVSARFLSAESDGAEQTGAGGAYFDFLSNGVKVRTTSNQVNTSSGTYIYAAFAENPFKYSRAR